MNDPITRAAKNHVDRQGTPDTPDTPAPGAPGTRPVHTLLEEAATCRPLEEVTALVSLLKESGQLPNPGHEALRAAAVTRPVHEVQRMVALLGEPPHEVVEADITLRAAAVGRPIEDVALLVTILGTEEQRQEHPQEHRTGQQDDESPTAEEPEMDEKRYVPPYMELYDAPYAATPRVRAEDRAEYRPEADRAGTPLLRHLLRWSVVLALLVSGALHLPRNLTVVPAATPAGLLPLLAAVLCLGFGALLAVRDTAMAWRAGAAMAVGVVALHVLGGAVGFAPLAGAMGGSRAWAGALAVLCAAAGAVLAGLALRNRQEDSA
ncbi:hypothetical protein ACFTWH_35685 [Streptomyces sp. NPDC057011]|uniref:hypothetical protein n=1 Tax=unclassified Streptomyces TaxID=2593676 RepID=UPI00363B23B7